MVLLVRTAGDTVSDAEVAKCWMCGCTKKGALKKYAEVGSSVGLMWWCRSRAACATRMQKLSPLMLRALGILYVRPETATTVGAELTGRRSAYGPQTSAREGGRTLAALRRRRLVRREYDVHSRKWLWSLTPEGRRQMMKAV